MMIDGWKSYDAFRRYVHADEIMLQKRMGKWEEDDSWKHALKPASCTEYKHTCTLRMYA